MLVRQPSGSLKTAVSKSMWILKRNSEGLRFEQVLAPCVLGGWGRFTVFAMRLLQRRWQGRW